MTEDVKRVDGQCPTCGGEASIYPNPENRTRGHIYCQEGEMCGETHRDFPGVRRWADEKDWRKKMSDCPECGGNVATKVNAETGVRVDICEECHWSPDVGTSGPAIGVDIGMEEALMYLREEWGSVYMAYEPRDGGAGVTVSNVTDEGLPADRDRQQVMHRSLREALIAAARIFASDHIPQRRKWEDQRVSED